MEASQPHHVLQAAHRAAGIWGQALDGDISVLADHREEMAHLLPWLALERFDRRALNNALAGMDAEQERTT